MAKPAALIAALLLCVLPVGVEAASIPEIAKTLCATCHGPDGNGIAPTFPKLAGQSKEYLAKQITDFIALKRKNDVMLPIIAQIKAKDAPALADYFTALKQSANQPNQNPLATAGQKLYADGNLANGVPACIACHGPKGAGNLLNARLAGQYESYLVAQLQAFKKGERKNDTAAMMRNAVVGLQAAEIDALAAYLAGI
jgi:cytochrome c553